MPLGSEQAKPQSGGDLFIVDNSLSGWTGLEYLRQWTDLAKSFDIATGFFEIGALLALDDIRPRTLGLHRRAPPSPRHPGAHDRGNPHHRRPP